MQQSLQLSTKWISSNHGSDYNAVLVLLRRRAVQLWTVSRVRHPDLSHLESDHPEAQAAEVCAVRGGVGGGQRPATREECPERHLERDLHGRRPAHRRHSCTATSTAWNCLCCENFPCGLATFRLCHCRHEICARRPLMSPKKQRVCARQLTARLSCTWKNEQHLVTTFTGGRTPPVIREEGARRPAGAHAGQQLRGDVQRRRVRVFRKHDVPVAPRRVRHSRREPRLQLRADALRSDHLSQPKYMQKVISEMNDRF